MNYQTLGHVHFDLERVKKITVLAASVVDELVFSFGHLGEDDPEREILKNKISDVLAQWSHMVGSLGATPMDLWTVSFKTPEGEKEWQYPCSSFVENFKPLK